MKRVFFILGILVIGMTTSCQSTNEHEKYNFSFEKVANNQPLNWQTFGSTDYLFSVDSTVSQDGKNSALIQYNGAAPEYKACSYTIPEKYAGEKIKLTGYLKTENVTGGWAGLWMRIDPGVSFDNMQQNGVKGTTAWKKYEITLDLNPEKAEQIVVGALLVGKGKVWVDNLEITIDGKTLSNADLKKLLPADTDHQFDKGSNINKIELNDSRINNLETLGLVWGFLKYYHPNIAKGNYNWDYALFRILPKYLNVKDVKERDAVLSGWIESLGKFEPGDTKEIKEGDISMKPDLDWINQSDFSDQLKSELVAVQNAKRTSDNYYIGLQPGVGNPDFKHENAYADMKYPDTGFRLLSLFRYWNKIQYYYPYKNLIGEDWKNVLKEFIPKFINASSETEYTLAALELIASIHDTHANIWNTNESLNKFIGINYPPVKITFVENKPVVTGYYNDAAAKASGLVVGDEITSINNKPVSEIIKEELKYTPASNYPTQLRNISLLRSNDSSIKIEYKRNNKIASLNLKTYPADELNLAKYYGSTDTCFKMINKDIAYLYPGTFKNAYLPNITGALNNSKGLIIDMRCYPREFMVFTFGKYLMAKSTPFVKFSTGSITTPGLFEMGAPLNVGEDNPGHYTGKIVILVNETTQSQAEYTTMAFSANPNVTVIGSTTAGADGNVSPFYLVGGIRTMISGIGVFYPDGRGTQRIGIVPDEVVKPTIEGIKNGKDEVLERAIEIINKK
ncbi:MAG: S41 family peptidase [Ginsengibacter sp.]